MRAKSGILNATRLAGASVACLLLVGCGTLGLNWFGQPEEPVAFRRVALVEFYDRSQYSGTAQRFARLLRDELAELVAPTDVIVIERSPLPSLEDPFAVGRIPLKALVRASKYHMADAVVIGSIDHHNPYWKPSLYVSLKVIETASATVPYEFSEGWDAKFKNVRRDIDSYYKKNYGRDDCRFGSDLFVISPRYFLKFVANRVAEKLRAAI